MAKVFDKISCISIVVIASLTLTNSAFATDDTEVDIVNITVPVSCTMDGVGMNSHTASIDNHDFETEIGSTTLTAYCNDANGFSIYAIGYSDEEYGNTDLIGQATNELIPTGTTLDGTVSNWAMKLATTNNATYPITLMNGYGSYHSVPANYTLVAQRQAATDVGTAAIGSVLTTTYAASVSPTQMADTYVGKVRYTLVHPYTEAAQQPYTTGSGKICYYPNGSNVEGAMGCWTLTNAATSATLLASNFSREGYGFAGWSTTFDYSDPNGFLGPQETISFTAGQYTGSNPGLSLYAHWIKSEGNLQDFSCPNNTAMPIGAVKALTDQRDNETYAIAKLADGKCWMIENLRLDNTAAHNSDGSLAQGYGTSAIYGNFSGLANPESTDFSISTTPNSLYYSGSQSGTANIDIGNSDNPGCRFPRYNHTSTSTRASSPTTNGAAMYGYGNYYTWHAAIADLTNNSTNNNSTTGTSLCPRGWRLPKGGNKTYEANNEFWSLVVDGINNGIKPANYDSSSQPFYTGRPEGSNVSNGLRAYPNNFLYSGYFDGASVSLGGLYGSYLTSTAGDIFNSYVLYFSISEIYPGTIYSGKYTGRSIRCLTPGT